jgi:hypothetical protein
MQESTLIIPCISVVTISMALLTYTMKPRWIPAIALVGSALDLFGLIRFDYFHEAHAKYIFSIPGIALMGVSVALGIHRCITQWKRERV